MWIIIKNVLFNLKFYSDTSGKCGEATRHIAAIVIVLSWAELLVLVGRHPKLKVIEELRESLRSCKISDIVQN